MSNHVNHRRGERARTEHGPSWESANPGKGCNSTHVARARRKYQDRRRRRERLQLARELSEALRDALPHR